METGLRLLMRDGTLHVVFRPRLDAQQYEELSRAVEVPRTLAELRDVLTRLAGKWNKQVEFDN